MKLDKFIRAMGSVDDELVKEAQSYKEKSVHKKRIFLKVAVASFSFILVGSFIFWLNRRSIQDTESALKFILIPVEGHQLAYRYLDVSEKKIKKISKEIYEEVDGAEVYRLKEEDNYLRLIVLENGTYSMVEYLETAYPLDYKTILKTIYGISSGKDIKKLIVTDKYDRDKTKITDGASKERFYDLLSKITISEPIEYDEEPVPSDAPPVDLRLSEHEQYEIKMFFGEGEKYDYLYVPQNSYIYGYAQTLHWSEVSVEDNKWLSDRIEE